ncbi:MAG: prenyltransferase/squalene oxidase repeat-containing protein [Anaerolineales bacterium]
MTNTWKAILLTDPLPALLDEKDPALTYFVQRDLLEQDVGPVQKLWELPEAIRLVAKQQADGSWRYPGKSTHPATGANYDLLETYRFLRQLVEMYGFQREQPALAKAAEYVFACQIDEGDIRGILGNQYMPYYHAAILELLIKAGYTKDARINKGLEWLLSMRQADGGWIIPLQLVPARQKNSQLWEGPPILPDRSRSHAHLATGMILRAFAAHPDYRPLPEVLTAGERLMERFFQADKYNDRKAPSYWLKFQFPFWWPNLLTALDSLAWLGFTHQDKDIGRGLAWFTDNQSEDGLWETGYCSGRGAERMRCWVGLAVCRMLKRFYDS